MRVLFTVHEENKGPFTVHEENNNTCCQFMKHVYDSTHNSHIYIYVYIYIYIYIYILM